MSALLLIWFDRSGRVLPWRLNKDPYRILLSEIMLQQTQVQTVIPYFERFLQVWPTVADLAAAPEEGVLKQWEGLGYYSRARHLHAAARQICQDHHGQVPADWRALRALPGIGDYTAGAILSIAFGQPVAAVDGNVVRVFARLAGVPWDPSDPAQRREVGVLVSALLPKDRPGDWNEALMDLGATLCLPRQPDCAHCPLAEQCVAKASDRTGQLPVRPNRKPSPTENKTVLVLSAKGLVHIHRRPKQGLLAGLWEFDWLADAEKDTAASMLSQLYPQAMIRPLGPHTHVFTHLRWQITGFLLELADTRCMAVQDESDAATDCWATADQLAARPFPGALAGYREQVLQWLRRGPTNR